MWEKVKLGEICEIINGYAFKSSKYVETNGARVIRITNVQKGKIVDNDPKLYPFNLLDKLDNFEIKENHILMSLTGNVGRVGLFPKELLPAYLNQRVCKITPLSERISKKYLYHYLNSSIFEIEAINASGGAAQLNLSSSWVSKHEIPLPPLHIQEKIAEILDKADELRRKDQELQDKYDQLAQAIFIDMFGDPVKNEKGFRSGTIRDLVKEVKYGTSSPAQENGMYPYLRMNNITYNGSWDYSSIKYINATESDYLKYGLEYGDLIFNRTNSKELVGKTAVYKSLEKVIIAGYLIRVRVNNLAHPDYISAYLNSKHGKKTLVSMCKNIVGQANINAQELQDIKILIPPIHLQEEFAKKIEIIHQLKAQTNAEKSEELFQSLLQKAFK